MACLTLASADWPLNLLNAIRVAGTPVARGKGALVVINDEINGARDLAEIRRIFREY